MADGLRPERTRTSCSSGSTGRPTATGSSTSATSSASATGSTACGRATASSSRASCSSRPAASTSASTMPGGGYANLELYERVTLRPDVNLVTILGEGSFHQVHGGTTTNHGRPRRPPGRRVTGYADPSRTCGRQVPSAVTTSRALRRHDAARGGPHASAPAGAAEPVRGNPPAPDRPRPAQPIPRDLSTAFVESYWNSLAWQATDVARPPTSTSRPPTCSPTRS